MSTWFITVLWSSQLSRGDLASLHCFPILLRTINFHNIFMDWTFTFGTTRHFTTVTVFYRYFILKPFSFSFVLYLDNVIGILAGGSLLAK